MAIELKTYTQILDDLKNQLVSKTGIPFPFNEGDVILSILEGVALQLADLYSTSLEILKSYMLDYASGDVLSLRGAEVTPRRLATYSQGKVVFTKASEYLNTEVVVPVGTVVSVPPTSTQKEIKFRTLQPVVIPAGQSSGIGNIIALEPGKSGNVSANSITKLVSVVPGIQSVNNPAPTTGGQDTETDTEYRLRIRQTIQGLARATYPSVLTACYGVSTTAGQTVRTAEFVPISGNKHYVYVNDGTTWSPMPVSGSTTFSQVPTPANVLTLPWYPTLGSVMVEKNGTVLTEGTDYWVVYNYRQVLLKVSAVNGDNFTVTANYYDDELITRLYEEIGGDLNDPVGKPGYCPAGVQILFRPAGVIVQNVEVTVTIDSRYDTDTVKENVKNTITALLNSKKIAEPLYRAEIVDRVMEVDGVVNCNVVTPSSDVSVNVGEVIRAGTVTVGM